MVYSIVWCISRSERYITRAVEGPRQSTVGPLRHVLGGLQSFFFSYAPQTLELFSTLTCLEGRVGDLREGYELRGCIDKMYLLTQRLTLSRSLGLRIGLELRGSNDIIQIGCADRDVQSFK